MKKYLLIVFFVLPRIAFALQAFPGAIGDWGGDTPHARDASATVIYVTNTNESGAGSFAAAVQSSGPRYILFKVSGYIDLIDDISITNDYLYIAGQTAPGDGIVLRGASIIIRANHVLVRGMRFRPGDGATGEPYDNRDGCKIDSNAKNTSNILVDHCSISFSIDELLSVWYSLSHTMSEVTIQNCLLGYALDDTDLHTDNPHGFGPYTAGEDVTKVLFINNIIANTRARNPRLKGDSYIANNIIYNRMTKDVDIGDGVSTAQNVSVVGNLFIKGGSYSANNYCVWIRDDTVSGTQVYEANNDCSDYAGCRYTEAGGPDVWAESSPDEPSGLSLISTSGLKNLLLTDVGALPSDEIDTELLGQVSAESGGKIINCVEYDSGDADCDEASEYYGPWPTYSTVSVPTDTDNDGMPDSWETARGLNPNSSADQNLDDDSDGYHNIEEYLHSLYEGATTQTHSAGPGTTNQAGPGTVNQIGAQ